MTNEGTINRRAPSIGLAGRSPLARRRISARLRARQSAFGFGEDRQDRWEGSSCKKSTTNLGRQIVCPRDQFARETTLTICMEPYQNIYPQQNGYRGLPCTQNIYYPSVTSHFTSYASGLDSGHVAAVAAAAAGPSFSWGYAVSSGGAMPHLQPAQAAAAPAYSVSAPWRHSSCREPSPRLLAERLSPAEAESEGRSDGGRREGSAEWSEGGRSRQGPPALKEETRSSPKAEARREEADDSALQFQGEGVLSGGPRLRLKVTLWRNFGDQKEL